MTAYKIRGGSWTFAGTVTGSQGKRWACAPDPFGPGNIATVIASKNGGGNIEAFGLSTVNFSGTAEKSYIGAPPPSTSCADEESVANSLYNIRTVNVATGLGATASGTAETRWTFASAGVDTYIDWAGSWSVTLDADLVQEHVADSSNDSKGFPSYGGTAVPDATTGVLCKQYLRARVGGSLVVTANIGGASATASDTITAGNTFDVEVPECVMGGNCSSDNTTNTLGMTVTWQGSATVGGAGYSASNGGASATIDSGISLSTGDGDSASADFSGAPERAFSLSWETRKFNEAYTGSLTAYHELKSGTVTSTTFTGSGAVSGSQKQYTVSVNLNGSAGSASAAEYCDVGVWLGTASLVANNEVAAMWRMMQRGRAYDAVTIAHGTAFQHAHSAGTAIGPADLSKSLSPPIYLQTYRYLRLRVKASSAGSAFTVKIGTKQWTRDYLGTSLTAGTSFGYVIIDLCSPTNKTATEDTTDTIWPTPTTDGDYWGVTTLGTLEFTGLTAGVTYELDTNGIELWRIQPTSGAATTVEFLPAYPGWVQGAAAVISADTTSTTYYRRFVLGVTNGRHSLELADFYKVEVVSTLGGTNITYTQRAISDFKADIEATESGTAIWPGWTVSYASGVNTADGSANTDISPNWLNKNRPMTWLWGAGALYSGSAWSYGMQVDCGSVGGTAVKAQELYDRVRWIANTGDTFQHNGTAGTAGAIDLRAAAFLRAGAHGIAYGTAGTAKPDWTVSLLEYPGATSYGTAVTNNQGKYVTGVPYAPGQVSGQVTSQGYSGTAVITLGPRKRSRAVIKIGDVGGEWIALAVTPAQRWYRVYKKNGTLWFGAATNNLATQWNDADTGMAGYRPKIAVSPGKKPRVWMAYETASGGPIVSRYTEDEGASWTLAGTVATSGKWPAIELTHDGRRIHYWYDGGTVKGAVYDSQNNLMQGPSTVATGADDDAIDVRSVSHARGDWLIHLTYRSGGRIIDLNSTDGVTFT